MSCRRVTKCTSGFGGLIIKVKLYTEEDYDEFDQDFTEKQLIILGFSDAHTLVPK